MDSDDPYDLQRFVAAQEAGRSYERAVSELRAGRKTSHWIWFVFPQIAGLGHSPASIRYSISSLAEARAYLHHRLLGPRLAECTLILDRTENLTAEQILGGLDALKLRSCMTLFHRAHPSEPLFARILGKYFGGQPDEATDMILAGLR
jgi:uncharacterized protein (DUF1810 family)